MGEPIFLRSDTEAWWLEVFAHHYEEALSRANSLLAAAGRSKSGCLLTATASPQRVRFRGRQVRVYSFVYHLATRTVPRADDVVRHRCHDRLCINPAHLTIGSRAENKRDDWDHWANGTDHRLL
jgi:hypothetical protein